MVSIIVPVYNTEKYLNRCIDSILAQTYTDWELILVDDESTDGSLAVCEEYAKKDERIRVITQKNAGPAAARQNALSVAKGEWIMYLDSDDWVHEEILERLLEQQKETKDLMVCCLFVDVDDEGNQNHIQLMPYEILDCNSASECMYHMHETRYLTGSPCTKLIHKSLFEGVNFCSHVTIGEDYSMVLQLAQKAERVRVINQELYYRYVRRGSISHMGYSERHKEAFDNYMRVRLELIAKYPEIEQSILGFHTEFEMAVITAMCRNKHFDWEVIGKLKKDLRQHMSETWKNKRIPFYMKICAWLIAYPTRLFIVLFRLLYLMTGR